MTKRQKLVDNIKIGISILMFLGMGYFIYYIECIYPTEISQDIDIASKEQQSGRAWKWEMNKANELDSKGIHYTYDSLAKANPFRTGKVIYVLETKMGETSSYDYGTEEEISALKCIRLKDMEKYRKDMKEAKEREERARFVIDSVGQSGLDRLNDKSCN